MQTSEPDEHVTGTERRLPDILYHATPKENWPSIQERGLLASSSSHPGHPPGVYLTPYESVARNYAEMGFGTNTVVDWIVLSVDTRWLDHDDLRPDRGQEAEAAFEDTIEAMGYTFEDVLEGRIPWWVSADACGQLVLEADVPAQAVEIHEVLTYVTASTPAPSF